MLLLNKVIKEKERGMERERQKGRETDRWRGEIKSTKEVLTENVANVQEHCVF